MAIRVVRSFEAERITDRIGKRPHGVVRRPPRNSLQYLGELFFEAVFAFEAELHAG